MPGGIVRAAVVATALLLGWPALADTPVLLSPHAQQQLNEQEQAKPKIEYRKSHALNTRSDGSVEGVSYHGNDVYVGSYRNSTSPVTGRLTYSVFDHGVFTRGGDRYVGTFYFFHDAYNEQELAPSILPHNGTYIMVGDYVPKSGAAHTGIYYAMLVQGLFTMGWVEADEAFLADFEAGRRQQVAYYKEELRREQEEASGGLSFAQILALSLGAAVIGSADIPSADALQIGTAFATDVLSGGQTSALNQFIATQQSASAAASGALASGIGLSGGRQAATSRYQNDQVTINCPSGVSSVIPISYKTAACRSAMITFAKVYSCNMIDDMASAGAACRSACGDPQCRE
jgi:hypothetical protein